MTPFLTVPPEPHLCFNSLARDFSSAAGRGTPVTRVTPLPRRPLVSRETLTTALPVGGPEIPT